MQVTWARRIIILDADWVNVVWNKWSIAVHFPTVEGKVVTNELLVLEIFLSVDIGYDTRFEYYNLHDNFH